METKISEIRPLISEQRDRLADLQSQEPLLQQVPSAAKSEGGELGQLAGNLTENYATTAKARKPEQGELEGIVKDVKDYLSEMSIKLNFKIRKETGDVVVQVINEETGEVIRQLPQEDMLKLREKLEDLKGVLFDGKS
jgi:flagellar protein FlaG